MNEVEHPSKKLSKEMIQIIRSNSAAAEKAEQLLPEQLKLISQQNWFNLFVPQQYGGLNLSLPEAVRLEESLAWADGSLGWVVTLCSGAAMFIGFFNNELAAEVFSTPGVCLAGSGQARGIAKMVEDGYEISGTWPYASGALHASHFTANCIIENNGKQLLNIDATPVIKSFVFKKDEVTLQPNWLYIGLNATAGHSFSVNRLPVPSNRSFVIRADHACLADAIYHYPFLQMAEATLAVNTSGMCICFMDICGELIGSKTDHHPAVLNRGIQLLNTAELAIKKLRQNFYQDLNNSWQMQLHAENTNEESLTQLSETSRALAEGARGWVDKLYPYCGLAAARPEARINQVWRNIHTASQHSLLL